MIQHGSESKLGFAKLLRTTKYELGTGVAQQGLRPSRFYLVCGLVITGLVFYLPSNLIPVMTMTVNGDVEALTVMGGVREMLESGLWPVALIIFLASIVVPFLKLAIMTAMLLLHGKPEYQRARSMARRAMIKIGSWAMIDIFLLSIIAAVGQLGMLASVHAEPGALFFAGVLLCNIFAYELYDPAWIWQGPQRQIKRRVS